MIVFDSTLTGIVILHQRKMMFGHPALLSVAQTVLFASHKDIGIVFTEYFNPMPKATLALIATAVMSFFLSIVRC